MTVIRGTTLFFSLTLQVSFANTLPAHIALGERLFNETRFSENAFKSTQGDPALKLIQSPVRGSHASPFAGQTMSCASCHMSDQAATQSALGRRAFTDFATKSPIQDRADGQTHTPRRSPTLVGLASEFGASEVFHFDGEFLTLEDLVIGGWTGRNFGWTATEKQNALEHIAFVIRSDPEYQRAFSALSKRWKLNLQTASDEAIRLRAANLVSEFMRSLRFDKNTAYDSFLRLNSLPESPRGGETLASYTSRLRKAVTDLKNPQWIRDPKAPFQETELQGLRLFLSTPAHPVQSTRILAAAQCAECHRPPEFTDGKLHNVGETQVAFDTVHGRGAFARLKVPSLSERTKDPLPYLGAQAQFRNEADLGVWLVFANPEIPKPQSTLCRLMSGRESCDAAEWLPKALGRFKTPTLRDLSVREPYFHTGRHVRLENAVQHYAVASAFERLGELVNPPTEFKGMQLTGFEVAPLAAFLRSLDENSK